MEPRWTLTGGAALAGFHLAHRTTRELDLFWNGAVVLGDVDRRLITALRADGLTVETAQRFEGFAELSVSDGTETLKVDLVADPTARAEAPTLHDLDGVAVSIDTPREILANKLTTLLSRTEARDLIDVRALLASGLDLDQGLRDAPLKDGGFSPTVLAWVLQGTNASAVLRASGLSDDEARDLLVWRTEFIATLVRGSTPP